MKKIFLLLATLFCVVCLYAQTDEIEDTTPLANEEFFIQAELVFEGIYLREVYTYNPKGNNRYEDGYTIKSFKVQKVYKGDPYLKDSIIYVVSKGALLGSEKEYDKEKWNIGYISIPLLDENGITQGVNDYMPAIYFLTTSDFPDDINSKYTSYYKYKYVNKYAGGMKFDKMYVCENKVIGLDSLVFHQREDFYNYMRQFEGFTIPESESQLKMPNKEILEETIMDTIPQERIEYYDALREYILQQMKQMHPDNSKKKKLNPPKSPDDYNTITFKAANQQSYYDAVQQKYYLTFDILASTNNPALYFDHSFLNIRFNSALCGPSGVLNGKITITKGTLFSQGNNYELLFNDNGANHILAFLHTDNNNPVQNRVKLSTTPVAFLHCIIQLLPNLVNVPSHYTFIPDEKILSGYTLTANTLPGYFKMYDEEIFINSDTLLITTKPSIHSISPISRIAGTGEILTIQGSNFGNTQGTSTIYFKAVDDGGQTYLKGLENQYIKNWSNTQIQVRIPSLVYKGYELEPYKKYSEGAGSGTIKIKTLSTDSCISTQSLSIPYSVKNDRNMSNNIYRVHLTRQDCHPDYELTLHSEFNSSSHTAKINAIDSALRHWSELTGLYLTLERNAAGNYVFTNDTSLTTKNIIRFHNEDYAEANNNVAISGYYDTLMFRHYGGTHIKIPRITSGYTWNYNITDSLLYGQRSFYEVIMHELGHILQLAHVNNNKQLMYFQTTGSHKIIRLKSSDTTVLAVKEIIKASKANENNWKSNLTGVYPPGALHATFKTTKSCYGANNGLIATTVTGGKSPYTYLWKKNGVFYSDKQHISNLAPGDYTLQLKDTLNCVQYYTVTVLSVSGGSPLSLNIIKINANPPIPELYKANVTGGVSPFTFKWSSGMYAIEDSTIYKPDDDKGLLCSLPSSYVNTDCMPASYHNSNCKLTVTVTDNNGCQILGSPPPIKGEEMSINDKTKEIILYPNPTAGSFTISNITDATIYLYSSLASHIKTFEHVSNNETINIGNLSNGIYFLKIIDGNIIKNEKLIINK